MFWWEKNKVRDIQKSYHDDEEDAKEFASHVYTKKPQCYLIVQLNKEFI